MLDSLQSILLPQCFINICVLCGTVPLLTWLHVTFVLSKDCLYVSGVFVPVFYLCQTFQQLCSSLCWGDLWHRLSPGLFVLNFNSSSLLFPLMLKFAELFFVVLLHFVCCWTVEWSVALKGNLHSLHCCCDTTNTWIGCDQISS